MSSASHPISIASTPSVIKSPAFGPTIPTPMTRFEPSSKRTLVTPSFRPNERLRPLAAHGNFPFP